ncbi:MAG: S41 family peptidase, partial [Bacilli bacterium]
MKKHFIRLGILFCLSFYIPYSVHAKEAQEQQEAIEKIEKAFQLIQEQYVQPTEAEELVNAAIDGMVKSLKDPYSMYMDEQMAKQFEQSLGSSFEGIGAEIAKDEKHLIIVAP